MHDVMVLKQALQTMDTEFAENGFVLIRGVADASRVLADFIEQFKRRSTLPFSSRMSLQNLARVPSTHCPDATETDHLSLHFEMGLPLVPVEDSSRIFQLICLHIPSGSIASPVATRLLPITGLAKHTVHFVEQEIISYCHRSAASMGEFNSGRLLCAAQIFDALCGFNELGYMSEHRISQWFNTDEDGKARDGLKAEQQFFSRCGIDLAAQEQRFVLAPGDLLIVDNLRVAHGRHGKRPAEELTQYLYGVADAHPAEINAVRRFVAEELTKRG